MLRKALLDLRAIWKILLLMALLNLSLFPLIEYYQARGAYMEMMVGNVLQQIQLITPVVCALPVGMILRLQLEEGCAEPIHALPMVSRRGPWSLLLVEIFLLAGYTLPLFIAFAPQFRGFYWQEWLRTMAQGFFLQNLIFAAGYLTHLSLAGLGVLALSVGVMQFSVYSMNYQGALPTVLNIYSAVSGNTPRPWEPGRVVIVALCGIVLWVIAGMQTKYFMDSTGH